MFVQQNFFSLVSMSPLLGPAEPASMLSIWGSQEKSRESITRSLACSLAGRLTRHKWRAFLHARSGPSSQTRPFFMFYLFLPFSSLARRTARWHKDGLTGRETISFPLLPCEYSRHPVFAEGLRSEFSGIHAGVTLEEKLREKFRF